jgi:radical SAM PhpK family P-methyltransferase
MRHREEHSCVPSPAPESRVKQYSSRSRALGVAGGGRDMDSPGGHTDCLIVGFNDGDFESYVGMVSAMGTDSGAFQDLRLAYVDFDGKPHRALDVLSRLHGDGRQHFHNADFLWPVVTYLGTFLDRWGLSFDYVNLFHLEQDALSAKLARGGVASVAITTTLYVSPHPILEIVEFVRARNRDIPIIVGGPYVSNQVKGLDSDDFVYLLEALGADIYVVGREGELTLSRVVQALRDHTPLDKIPNLAFRRDGEIVQTGEEVESNSLPENLVDYRLFAADINDFVTTRTAKSCPFSCAFCGFPQRAGKYTYMPVSDVQRELDAIAELSQVSTITFIDDTFNVPKRRFRKMLQMMIERGYGFRWNSFYRSDHGDPATIELMAAAGCEGVFLGVESGSDEMLVAMNKASRRADYLEALEMFRRVGISTYASLIVGFPGETDDTAAQTKSFLEEGRPDFFRAQLWYCDPVTPIFERRHELGIEGEGFTWSHATMDTRRACEHIDRLFLEVENSIWLPQFGFEQWSTFYLQRRGMSLPQIKRFLIAFNTLVAEQAILHDGPAREAELLDELARTSQFEPVVPRGRVPVRNPADA